MAKDQADKSEDGYIQEFLKAKRSASKWMNRSIASLLIGLTFFAVIAIVGFRLPPAVLVLLLFAWLILTLGLFTLFYCTWTCPYCHHFINGSPRRTGFCSHCGRQLDPEKSENDPQTNAPEQRTALTESYARRTRIAKILWLSSLVIFFLILFSQFKKAPHDWLPAWGAALPVALASIYLIWAFRCPRCKLLTGPSKSSPAPNYCPRCGLPLA